MEGFATFVNSITEARLNPHASTAAQFPLSVNFDLGLLRDLIHNRLEYTLSLDFGSSEFNPRTPGSIFYMYIYEEFGMEKVIEVYGAMSNSPPPAQRIPSINDILGADIEESFPAWLDGNVHRISGRMN